MIYLRNKRKVQYLYSNKKEYLYRRLYRTEFEEIIFNVLKGISTNNVNALRARQITTAYAIIIIQLPIIF